MHLILVRHGNTFEPHQVPYMVGCREDPPLTMEGESQAERLRDALIGSSLQFDAIYSAELIRTRRFAEIVAAPFNHAVVTDHRLNELNYGTWSGLTAPQIEARFGAGALHAWNAEGEVPAGQGWSTPSTVIASCRSFLEDCQSHLPPSSCVLAVTSNGLLRFFLKLFPELWIQQQPKGLKVATGAACGFRIDAFHSTLQFWNITAEKLAPLLPEIDAERAKVS